MDLDLLALLKTKTNWQRFRPFLQEHVLAKETNLIVNTIDSYYKHFASSSEIDWAAFESYFFVLRNSQLTAQLSSNYRSIFTNLKGYVPTIAADDVLRHFVTADYANRIVDEALKIKEGTGTIDAVGELVATHDKELGRAINPSDLFVTGGVADVLALASAPGLEWRLEELNISCGPLRQGDFVIVAAYVETGKTTFAASEVTHMASQMKHERPVIWINNEERSDKVQLRVMQAALGLTVRELNLDVAKAQVDYDRLMGMPNRILILNNDRGMNNASKLDPVFRDLNPALIVFDQLDKVGGFHVKDGEEHSRLGRVYNWARDLGHEFGPVMAISQTDASGATSQYITMDQLRGSKVDKPGEADAIITIGRSTDRSLQKKRYIHVPKNKLFGGPRSVVADSHGFWEVEIEQEIARYVGTR